MGRTTIDLDGQTDLPITEAALSKLGDGSVADNYHRHNKLSTPEGTDALSVNSDKEVQGLKLQVEETLAVNDKYEIGDMWIYHVPGGWYYIATKTADGTAMMAVLPYQFSLI